MLVIIFFLSFISLFFSFGIWSNSRVSKKEILLSSMLIFSLVVILITEFLSLIHQLNFQFILISWVLFIVINAVYIYKKGRYHEFISDYASSFKSVYRQLGSFEIIFMYFIGLILALVFIQGVIYPPNNLDSLVYHLARIANWIGQQSVEHYPTHTFRQIYQPPFSEFFIMHVNILNGEDYFSNSVQYFFLLFCIVAVVSIMELFALGTRYQFIGVALIVTIPEAILQASSTQNDIVISFFILSTAYFAIKAIREVRSKNYLFLGLSVGIAILTKGTAYIFLAPILLIFGIAVVIKGFRTMNFIPLGYSFISLFIFLTINLGHYSRNYKLVENILGLDRQESELYTNEKMSPILLISSMTKSAALHLGPAPLSHFTNKVIRKLHLKAGIDIDNPENNIFDKKFEAPYFPFHEDNAPNPIHMVLIFFSFLAIVYYGLRYRNRVGLILLYGMAIVLGVLLFCLYLKWQPWHTRLHTPLFMLSLPVICYAVSLNSKFNKIAKGVIIAAAFYAFIIVLFNSTRPFISRKSTEGVSLKDDRSKKYVVSRYGNYGEYKVVIESLNQSGCKNVGLILGDYLQMKEELEYVFFKDIYSGEIRPFHINVHNNPTKKIPANHAEIDCIISSTTNDTSIHYRGRYYYNKTNLHKNLWLYK